MSEEEAAARFEELQAKLVPLWRSIGSLTQEEQTIVVIPSLSLDQLEEAGLEMQAYEERFLFLLFLLRQPRARMVYVTSRHIEEDILDYYFHLLPGVIPSHARRRFFNPAPMDGAPRSLSHKLLERPRLIEEIRELIHDPDRAHMVPYNTTMLERDLALRLGIPMYAADPRYFHLGTKSGCRQLFADEGVPHPLGFEDLHTMDQLVDALTKLRAERPTAERAIVKLNEGTSGGGNAQVDLAGLPAPGDERERDAITDRVRNMAFEFSRIVFDDYIAKLDERGGIVEELITGVELRSPSVQLRNTPLGEVELLSTHDQLLGGPTGQVYLGATFPADRAYAAAITREAAKVGRRLAAEGVIGRYALDFVVVRRPDGTWDPFAIEVNLRKGGTTHPFLTLQFLTDGAYDPEAARFTAPSGREKYFVASDHVDNSEYKAITTKDLFDIVARHGLHFDQTRQTGVVFHMMTMLSDRGRTGLTAVADSAEEAQSLYERTVSILDAEAADAVRDRGLPRR